MLRKLTIIDWNRLVPLGLIGGGAAVTALAFAADLLRIGDLSGIGPNQFSVALSGFAILVAGVVLISPMGLRPVAEGLLIGIAVLAAVFAADLVVTNGLPEWPAKLLVLAAVGVSVLSISAVPADSWDGWSTRSWLGQFSLEGRRLGAVLSVVLQLTLLALVTGLFHLETQALYHNIMLLTLGGFLIHYLLPARYRLSYFLLLSLAALAGILGVVNAIWLIAIGLGLLGLAHLRVSYTLRAALLLTAGIGLAAIRAGWIEASWLDAIWPILASMFMFRMIVYMYDLKHGKARPTLTSTLSYFFLYPNVVFPFFPIIDYGTFRRTYYDDEQHAIYQRGLQWMLRGVVQLILYRWINYYLMIAPQEVTDPTQLVRYLVALFALYVRISGLFHLIVGILHLFGFNLPETHHRYFLASSLTDLWRRINIYWKDFMLKVFYYPVYFRIRQWGPTTRMVLATAFVFFLTWLLHAYQWFWIRGSLLFTAQDTLFWLILALLIVANMLYEARRGRDRAVGQRARSLGDTAKLALRTAGVFTVMSILWSLWSADSIRDWISLLSVVQIIPRDIAVLVFAFLGLTVVVGVALWVTARGERNAGPGRKQVTPVKTAAVTGGSLLCLLLLGDPAVYGRVGGQAQVFLADLTVNRLSDREAVLLQRGYYEDLVGVDRFNAQLWEIYSKRPSDWPSIMETEVVREAGDSLIFELVPSKTISFHGAELSTNRWGMRDRDYEGLPAPDTYRIALTGPSFVMGSGVANDEVFEWLLEDRLNREHAGSPYARYEILNFAVPGYSAIQELVALEEKGVSFQPHALFFIAHQREEEAVVMYLADRLSVGAELPYEGLEELAHRAGLGAGATKVEGERRLQPFGAEILSWTYRRIVETSRAHGILPVWIFVPTLENPLQDETVEQLARLAKESGFVVVDLSDAYDDQNLESLVVAYWDKHPNAEGHRLLADRLYQTLQTRQEEIPLYR
jgi:D-alanyl-lipoteichoic acid acyltransferase DltB (MBOAT superfamily)